MTQLTQHFSETEFTASDTAARDNIDNSLPRDLLKNATATCMLLERIRFVLSERAGKDIAITISSGYRCPKLNTKIGSGVTSDHLLANATDFKAASFGTPYNIATALAPLVDSLGIGQLIYEFDSWVHISTVKSKNPVNRVLTINRNGTTVGITK